jgi:hypothetical protein
MCKESKIRKKNYHVLPTISMGLKLLMVLGYVEKVKALF